MPPCHSEWSEAKSNCVAAPKAESRRHIYEIPMLRIALRVRLRASPTLRMTQPNVIENSTFHGSSMAPTPTDMKILAVTFNLNSILGDVMNVKLP